MKTRIFTVIAVTGLTTVASLLAACATHRHVECDGDECERADYVDHAHGDAPEVTKAADPATRAALFGRVAKLEGEWIMDMTAEEIAQQGPPQTSIIKVTSGGSIVRDIMFPGSEHEMTNVYHMDGDELVMTHYCAIGNQPRMEAELNDGHNHAANEIHFQFDEVSNLTSADQGYMGEVVLTFVDDNHYMQTWKHFQGGKVTSGPVMKWKRK